MEDSWAGTFYQNFFCLLDEDIFDGAYSDKPSRPNMAVNVLVGFEVLKAGFGYSDEGMHAAYNYDMQVRYAFGYRNLGEGEFELRTLYNFRRRLSEYMQETGVNLIEKAFEQVTDEQLKAFLRWREENLLKESEFITMADLGCGVLDTAMVETAAYVLRKAGAGGGYVYKVMYNGGGGAA